MIFIVDNRDVFGAQYRRLIFIEAPAEFAAWFNGQFVPWQEKMIEALGGKAWFHPHKIVATAPSIDFLILEMGVVSPKEYVRRYSFTFKDSPEAPKFMLANVSP